MNPILQTMLNVRKLLIICLLWVFKSSVLAQTVVYYADCVSGESQVWRYIEPISSPQNVKSGPDGSYTNITANASIITKFAKAFAVGDTIMIAGANVQRTEINNFQVLTSLDGVNYTVLSATNSFAANNPNLQTKKWAATQAFQYVKVVNTNPSSAWGTNFDMINVFGKVCETTPTACASGSSFVSNGFAYPTNAVNPSGLVISGNVAIGGIDGNIITSAQAMVVSFGQVLKKGGSLQFWATPAVNSSFPTGNFTVSFSTDSVNYSGTATVMVGGYNNAAMEYRSYKVIAPQDFKYIKILPADNTQSTGFDEIKYQGDFCKQNPVKYADCSSGESQIWQYLQPDLIAGSYSSYAWPVMNVQTGLDGSSTMLSTSTSLSLIAKFAKILTAGDTIVMTAANASSTEINNFQILTSLDGFNYTVLSATNSFAANYPNFQTKKWVATQDFQYVKVVNTNSSAVWGTYVDLVNVFGKVCATTTACTPKYTILSGKSVTGQISSGMIDNVLDLDNTIYAILYNSNSVVVDFGQDMSAGSDVYVNAAIGNTSFDGNFTVYISSDGVNFTTLGQAYVGNALSKMIMYRFPGKSSFRYVKVRPTGTNSSTTAIDFIGVGTQFCTPCLVTGAVTPTQATCAANGTANADALLTLSSYSNEATKVGYSAGSTYTGPAFSAATAVAAAPMTVANALSNPTAPQPYTIRIFKDAACYKDVVVTLNPKLCLSSNLSLTASPVTGSGAKGEILTYTFTLKNAGPDTASGVTAAIVLPKNMTYLSSQASQGSYNSATAIWDIGTVPVGSQTITVSLQVK